MGRLKTVLTGGAGLALAAQAIAGSAGARAEDPAAPVPPPTYRSAFTPGASAAPETAASDWRAANARVAEFPRGHLDLVKWEDAKGSGAIPSQPDGHAGHGSQATPQQGMPHGMRPGMGHGMPHDMQHQMPQGMQHAMPHHAMPGGVPGTTPGKPPAGKPTDPGAAGHEHTTPKPGSRP